MPAPAVAQAKGGLLLQPPDPIVTGSLQPETLAAAVAGPVDAKLEMPPPAVGAQALRRAAASGDARAQFIVAGRYLDGQGVAQDFGQAFAWYQQAAARGLAPAQYRLATLYELGKGVAADPVQALAWYERAALGGNVKAMHNAAVLLADDKAGPADFDRAFRWFKAAAERGFADSQFNLAILYERGLGTPPSAEEAYVWYSLSARQGDPGSVQRAATLAKNLPDADLRAADARLAAWLVTPSDDSGNVVTVIDPNWNDARSTAVKSSS
jgi:localization factor PodJL